jgi:uncharacterized protein YigE (DUF2233 family)
LLTDALRLWPALLAIAAAGCGQRPAAGGSDEPGFDAPKPACETRRFEGSAFTVCRFNAGRDELQLAWKGKAGTALRGFGALEQDMGADAARVRFAMNAGMFDDQGGPIGLYVERGRRLKPLNRNRGPGNFHLMPNGVFAIDHDGSVSVTRTATFAAKVKRPIWATQSGPMLVVDGKLHPRFDRDGVSRLVRNGVGVSDPRTAWFAISEEGVSFGRFARFFRDGLGCPNALFLDGSVSSLWDPGAGRADPYSRLGPIVVVLRSQAPKRH